MTSTPQNQPHIPQLQIDLDEILATIALELARVQICNAMPGVRSQPDR